MENKSPLCNDCKVVVVAWSTSFMSCEHLTIFWLTLNKAFSTCNINKKLDTIKFNVIDYNIPCKEYIF